MIIASSRMIEGQCGIGTLHNFYKISSPAYKAAYTRAPTELMPSRCINKHTYAYVSPIKTGESMGGCNLFGTGFINTTVMEEAYHTLCKHHKLVFQTPMRYNKNSHNMFFYAMFDKNKKSTDINEINPYWPFKKEEHS